MNIYDAWLKTNHAITTNHAVSNKKNERKEGSEDKWIKDNLSKLTPEAKTLLYTKGDFLELFEVEDGTNVGNKMIIPAIEEIKWDKRYPKKVSFIFKDGSEVSATPQGDDEFNLDTAIMDCLFKRVLAEIVGIDHASSVSNKLFAYAKKVIREAEVKAEEDRKAKEEAKDRARSREIKKQKRAAKNREKRINERKEAIIRAVAEIGDDITELKKIADMFE